MDIIEDIQLALTSQPVLYYTTTDMCKQGKIYYRESSIRFPQYVVLHPDDFGEFKQRIEGGTNKKLIHMKHCHSGIKPVVYTLPVIDGDKVLVSSRAIELETRLDRVQVGEGIRHPARGLPERLESITDGYWALPNNREFRLNACAIVPTDQVDKDEVIWTWERVK